MVNYVQIPQLPPATKLTGDELLEAVQNNTSVRVTAKAIAELGGGGGGGVTGPTGPAGPIGPTGEPGVPGARGATGPTGADASALVYQGAVPTADNLPATGNTDGDTFVALDTGRLWVYKSPASFDALGAPVAGWANVAPASAGVTGPTGPTGATGKGVLYKGQVPSESDLPKTGNVSGDSYTTEDTHVLYVWDGLRWNDEGTVTIGVTGATGPTGADGKQGLRGVTGEQGIQGETGPAGPAGQTANLKGEFHNRVPSDLPADGLIPKDFDGPNDPPVAIQFQVKDALLYTGTTDAAHTGCVYVFEGTGGLEVAGWINAGRIVGPTGATGPQGVAGVDGQTIVGPTGSTGATGATGVTGEAGTIAVGLTTTGAPGTSANVVNTGTAFDAVFNFTIPQGVAGPTGATGVTGTAATISVGTTTTGNPGTNANVVNAGSSAAALFNFTIPQGPTGPTGSTGPSSGVIYRGQVNTVGDLPATGNVTGYAYTVKADDHLYIWDGAKWTDNGSVSVGPQGATGTTGATGSTGITGTAATVGVGTTTTGNPGTQANVTNTGTSSAATFNFTVPQGPTGPTGVGTPGPTGPTGATGLAEFASGTRLLFQQASAPTGWSRATDYTDNSALRIVTGSVGSGGSVPFTSAFTSQAVSGTVSGGTVTGTVSGTCAGSVAGGTVSGTVGSYTLTKNDIPSHTHGIGYTAAYFDKAATQAPPATSVVWLDNASTVQTYAEGGGGGHSHSFSGTVSGISFTGGQLSGGQLSGGSVSGLTLSGNAINLAVQYVDAIICKKD